MGNRLGFAPSLGAAAYRDAFNFSQALRMLTALTSSNGEESALQTPFIAYANLQWWAGK
jgi:hypothetical protein